MTTYGARRWRKPVRRLAGCLVAIVAGSCSSGAPPTVAARVAGHAVPADKLEQAAAMWLAAQTDTPDRADERDRKEARKLLLTFLIRSALLKALADQHGVSPSAEELDVVAAGEIPASEFEATGWTRDDFTDALRNGRLSKSIALRLFPVVDVAESDLRRKYDSRAEVLNQSWRATVDVATFSAAAGAQGLVRRVRRGETFEAAAEAEGAGEIGALGAVTPTTPLPAPVIAAIASARQGQVTDPVPSAEGLLVAFVRERDDHATVSYEAARDDLKRVVEDERRQRLFAQWFDERLRGADVLVTAKFGTWNRKTLTVD